MNLSKAIQIKLSDSAKEAESAWRADFNSFISDIDPINGRDFRKPIDEFSKLSISLIRLKAALLVRAFRDNLVSEISTEEYDRLRNYIISELDQGRYLPKLGLLIDSIKRSFSRYGKTFDPSVYRIDLIEAAFTVGVKNMSRSAIKSVEADLTIIQSMKSKGSALSTVNDIIELKPNFAGIAINLNAVLSKFV